MNVTKSVNAFNIYNIYHVSCNISCNYHWLPVRLRGQYRISTCVWCCVICAAPVYWSELFVPDLVDSPCRQSVHRPPGLIPRSTACPTIWDNFPLELRSFLHDLSGSFYGLLKSFFSWSWAGSASEYFP